MRATLGVLTATALLTACAPSGPGAAVSGGDPGRGKAVLAAAHCGACHQIPGVQGANGQVGPPLGGVGRRTILAGVLPNTPDNLVTWIRTPQTVKPGDAMPNSGLDQQQARDAAAYLEAR
ncbi:MAG TPA: c-type cytochrome [Caulobacteraceae bacterium]